LLVPNVGSGAAVVKRKCAAISAGSNSILRSPGAGLRPADPLERLENHQQRRSLAIVT
jgi:hypothetical protein